MKTITNDKPMLPILKKTTNEGSYRMGCINGLSSKEMLNLLGASNSKGDPDKTKWEWEFFYEGVRCLVWDYKGSYKSKSWSYYEEKEGTIKKLFSSVKNAVVLTNEELYAKYLQIIKG